VLHNPALVIKERETVKSMLKQDMTDRGITTENLQSEAFLHELIDYFENDKEQKNQSDLSYSYCYEHIWDDIERLTAQYFRYKRKPLLLSSRKNNRFSQATTANNRSGSGNASSNGRWRSSTMGAVRKGKDSLRSMLRPTSSSDTPNDDDSSSGDSDEDSSAIPRTPRTPGGTYQKASWRSQTQSQTGSSPRKNSTRSRNSVTTANTKRNSAISKSSESKSPVRPSLLRNSYLAEKGTESSNEDSEQLVPQTPRTAAFTSNKYRLQALNEENSRERGSISISDNRASNQKSKISGRSVGFSGVPEQSSESDSNSRRPSINGPVASAAADNSKQPSPNMQTKTGQSRFTNEGTKARSSDVDPDNSGIGDLLRELDSEDEIVQPKPKGTEQSSQTGLFVTVANFEVANF
jgi:hypothetical protein